MHEQKIESVGIREFRSNMHKYTSAGISPIAITSHGEPIGFYIPVKPYPKDKTLDALRQASARFRALLLDSGLSEEDFMIDFKNEMKESRALHDTETTHHP